MTTVPAAKLDDSALHDDDTYTYTVTAIDGAGNGERDPSDPVQIPIRRERAAGAVRAAGGRDLAEPPSLAWMSGGPDALSGFDRYENLRNGVVAGTSTTESWSDNLLMQNGAWAYTIRSVDVAGATSAAIAAAHRDLGQHGARAAAGRRLTEPDEPAGLTWPTVSDTGGANGVVSHVFRDGVEIGSTPLATYTDHDPLSDATYTYRVRGDRRRRQHEPAVDAERDHGGRDPAAQVPSAAGYSPTQRPVITWGSRPRRLGDRPLRRVPQRPADRRELGSDATSTAPCR